MALTVEWKGNIDIKKTSDGYIVRFLDPMPALPEKIDVDSEQSKKGKTTLYKCPQCDYTKQLKAWLVKHLQNTHQWSLDDARAAVANM